MLCSRPHRLLWRRCRRLLRCSSQILRTRYILASRRKVYSPGQRSHLCLVPFESHSPQLQNDQFRSFPIMDQSHDLGSSYPRLFCGSTARSTYILPLPCIFSLPILHSLLVHNVPSRDRPDNTHFRTLDVARPSTGREIRNHERFEWQL